MKFFTGLNSLWLVFFMGQNHTKNAKINRKLAFIHRKFWWNECLRAECLSAERKWDAWASVCVAVQWMHEKCTLVLRVLVLLLHSSWILCVGHTVKLIFGVDNRKTSICAMAWYELNSIRIYWRALFSNRIDTNSDENASNTHDDDDVVRVWCKWNHLLNHLAQAELNFRRWNIKYYGIRIRFCPVLDNTSYDAKRRTMYIPISSIYRRWCCSDSNRIKERNEKKKNE